METEELHRGRLFDQVQLVRTATTSKVYHGEARRSAASVRITF